MVATRVLFSPVRLMIGSWRLLRTFCIGLARRELFSIWRIQSNGLGLKMACFLSRICIEHWSKEVHILFLGNVSERNLSNLRCPLLGRLLGGESYFVISWRKEGWPLLIDAPSILCAKRQWTISFFIAQQKECCGIFFFPVLHLFGNVCYSQGVYCVGRAPALRQRRNKNGRQALCAFFEQFRG